MFRYIRELFTLIFLLFSRIDNVEDLKLLEMKYFPFRGYLYMFWCGRLIYRSDNRINAISEFKSTSVSLNHESIHLEQAKLCKSWIIYYLKYLFEWLKGNPFTYPSHSAYYTIPYEVEAYANEDDLTYTIGYDGKNLKERYTLSDRKKTYLLNKSCWKRWIRSL